MNVHILSNSPTRVNSGFGIACRGLALGLKEMGHSVSVSDMQNIYNKQYWNGITIYPMNSVANATTGSEFYISEFRTLMGNLRDSNADVMIIIYPAYDDVVVSNKLHEILKNTLWYYPVDGACLPKVYMKELGKVTSVIPYTKQGREELVKGGLGNVGKEIYLGFDEKTFYKFGDTVNCASDEYHCCKWKTDKYQLMQDPKVLCRRGCFACDGNNANCEGYEEELLIGNLMGEEYKGKIANLGVLKEQFGVERIFGFTGENNGKRKKIDRLLNSYSSMCKSGDVNGKETMLLLHTMPVSNNGLNLWDYIKKYDLVGEKVLFVYGDDELGNSWSDKALNVMYNSIDVNVSASGAEGFGLPVLESMAVGKPQIAPRFSSFIELIGENADGKLGDGRGLLADIQGYETLSNGIKRGLVSSKSLGGLMSTLVDDGMLVRRMGDNAYDWSREYTWHNVCIEFDNVLKGIEV